MKNNFLTGLIMVLLLVGVSFADEIPLYATIVADINIPTSLDFGTLRIGEDIPTKTLFQLTNMSTGAYVNITLVNHTGLASYNVIEPNSVVHTLEMGVKKRLDLSLPGNYSVQIIPKKVGWSADNILIEYDTNTTVIHRVD